MRKQNFIPGLEDMGEKEFGGSLLKNSHARNKRPISVKRPLHLVMRSSLAKNELSFLHPSRANRIESLIFRIGHLKGVKVYQYSNAGNHLHLIVQPRSREAFKCFVRTITGLIARITLGVERGRAKALRFWDAIPFTRILEWGREFRNVSRYVLQNTLEALKIIPYQKRKLRGASPGK